MKKAFVAMVAIAASGLSTGVRAGDREEEMFGGGSEAKVESPPTATTTRDLSDKIDVGGSVDLNWALSKRRHVKAGQESVLGKYRGEFFFDNSPTGDYRAFLRLRVSDGEPDDTLVVDEAWLRWDAKKSAFFTVGRQHLKWGAARFWNPTDFLARTAKDPWASRDLRPGQDLVKLHIPQEKQGFNYYLVADYGEVATSDDIRGAVRGEFALGSSAEFSLTLSGRGNGPTKIGSDVSMAAGPVDVYVEGATVQAARTRTLDGQFDPAAGTLPTIVPAGEPGRFRSQIVGGLSWAWKYSDQDSIILASEYFHNELGFDSIESEIYAVINGVRTPLYLGKDYAAISILLASPGSWDDLSFLLLGIQNRSDHSAQGRMITTWNFSQGISLEFSVSHCGGKIGEMCFHLPRAYASLATDSRLPEEARAQIAGTPTEREDFGIGIGVTAKF